jgi:lipoprotein-releasing system permease protein
LQENLVNETIGNSSQITIRSTRDDNVIINPDNIVDKIKKSEYADEIKSIVPVSETPGIIRLEKRDYSAFIRGFDFEEGNKIYALDKSLIDGELPSLQNEVLIGNEMAKELSLKKGDPLTVIIPPNVFFPKTVTISGIFKLGFGAANQTHLHQ